MNIKVEVSLSIGINNASQTDVLEIEVEDNWDELTEDERDEILQEHWQEWANNYIDGHIKQTED